MFHVSVFCACSLAVLKRFLCCSKKNQFSWNIFRNLHFCQKILYFFAHFVLHFFLTFGKICADMLCPFLGDCIAHSAFRGRTRYTASLLISG